MIRRARISVKPNFRPGGRSVSAEEPSSQTPTDENNTLPTVTAEKAVKPSTSPQQKPPVGEPVEAVAVKNIPSSPRERGSADLNNGEPTAPAAVGQRRKRITATPKLTGPKVTSTPRLSSRAPRAVPSSPPRDFPLQIPVSTSQIPPSVSKNSDSLSNSRISASTSSTQPSKVHLPSSPCVPSTSGLHKPLVCDLSSVEDSPPSPQPGQVPHQPPHEQETLKYPASASDTPSVCVKLSRIDGPGSPHKGDGTSSNTEKILKALKLKELMKIERRKDIKKGKKRVLQKQYHNDMDRSKMTMRDLIYYLPNTSPMRGSTVSDENQEEVVVPPSPKVLQQKMEPEQEEDEEESADEEMLMPKVRVAEDGSIILDEESLTVRVQRTSKTTAVDPNALFERGFTTTYTSFRNLHYTKSWSVRETDMFFLAISMVGTDFSMIGQLLPHRSRTEIKAKFKREEKTNGWRIDTAFTNKRPFDKQFFSFLLEKILAKDKEKGQSVRLVMKTSRKRAKARGKKAKDHEEQCISVSDDDIEDGGSVDAEKENEGVNKSENIVAKKKRKRKTVEDKDNKDKEGSPEEQGKRKKKRKSAKKTKKEKQSDGDAEGERGLFTVDDDPVNADKETELDLSASKKKKCKRSKKVEEEKPDEIPGKKAKRCKKSVKVTANPEESIDANEENGVMNEDTCKSTTKKRRRSQKGDLKEEKPAREKKNTKRKKLKKGAVEGEGTAEDGDVSVTPEDEEAKKVDTLVDKLSKRSKDSKKPAPKRRRKKISETEPTTEADEIQECQNESDSKFIMEGELSPSEAEQLQKQALVVLERTPPRVKHLLSPSKIQQKSIESEPSVTPPTSPAVDKSSTGQKTRMQRAERVKRNLTAEKKRKRKGIIDQNEAEPDPGTSAEDMMSPTDILQQMVSLESETEAENSLDEDLIDFSCLQHLNSPMFQRRPMVVLSREEVNVILEDQDQTSEEDPSLSPLDLSLNTELSFQCSNLMRESTEADQIQSVDEEHGLTPQESASCVVTFEEVHCEGLGLTMHGEPVLDQPDLSNPFEESFLKTDDHISQHFITTPADELEGFTFPLDLHIVAPEDPVSTKHDKPVTHKTLIAFPEAGKHDTQLASQDTAEESKTSLILTPEIKDGSQGFVLASSDNLVDLTPKIKEGSQALVLSTLQLKEDLKVTSKTETSLTSEVVAPEIMEESHGFILAAPKIKEVSQQSDSTTLETKEDFLGTQEGSSEVSEKSDNLVMMTPKIYVGIQESVFDLPVMETNKCLQESPVAPSEILERSKTDVEEIQGGSQSSNVANLAIKGRPEESVVAPAIAQEDDPKEQTVIPSTKSSADALVSSEHGSLLKRRSRFPKLKPNLSAAVKFTHSSPKQKAETRKTVSQKFLPAKDQSDSKALSKERLSTEVEEHQSCAVDGNESETAKGSLNPDPTAMTEMPVDYSGKQTTEVFSDASQAVLDQEHITTLPASEEPQLAFEQTSMDKKLPCEPVAEDLQMMDMSWSWPLVTQTTEQDAGQMNGSCEGLCAPAKIIQPTGDDHSEEEPTFILTLYEIPVTEAYSALSANDSLMTLDPHAAEDQSHPVPAISQSDTLCMKTEVQKAHMDITQNTLPVTSGPQEESNRLLPLLNEKALSDPVGEVDLQTLVLEASQQTRRPQLEDEVGDISAKLNISDVVNTDSDSECTEGPSESIPHDKLKPRHQSTPFTVKVSKRIAPVPQVYSEQCTESISNMLLPDAFIPVSEMGDDLTKDMIVEKPRKEEHSPTVSNPLFNLTEESEDKPSLLEKKKTPARKRGKLCPMLVKRPSGKEDCSKSASSQAALEISHQTVLSEEKQDFNTSANLEMDAISDVPKLLLTSQTKESCTQDLIESKDLQQKHYITPCTVKLSRCVDLVPQESSTLSASEVIQNDVKIERTDPEQTMTNIQSLKDSSNTKPTASASQETQKPVRRRGKLQVKPSLRVRKSIKNECLKIPQCDLEASESSSGQTISAAPKESELTKESSKTTDQPAAEDITVKPDMESSSGNQDGSILMDLDESNLQPSQENSSSSMMMTDLCSGSWDSHRAKEDCEGVSHVLLADVFVPVSEEMGDDLCEDWLIPVESNPCEEEFHLPEKQEVHSENIKMQEKPETSKEQQPFSKERKTPIRRKDKQKVKRKCTKKESNTETLKVDVPKTAEGHEAKECSELENLKEKLQKKCLITPCTVKMSRCTDSVPVDLEQVKDENKDVSKVVLPDAVVPLSEHMGEDLSQSSMGNKSAMSSSSFTPSADSREQAVLKKIRSVKPSVRTARKKVKLIVQFPFMKQTVKKILASKTSPPSTKMNPSKLPLVSQTRQLSIRAWAKKSIRTAPKLEAEDLSKTAKMESSLKAKESSSLIPIEKEAVDTKTCSEAQHSDSSEMREDVYHTAILSSSEDTEEASRCSTTTYKTETQVSKIGKESSVESSPSLMSKSSARQRAKLRVKPTVLRRRPARVEENSSESDQPQSTAFTSPTRQHARAARVKKESEKQTEDLSKTSRMEADLCKESALVTSDPQSPKSPWPKVVLPRLKVQTADAGFSSDSSTTAFSPVRVSPCTSQPVTPPQVNIKLKSPEVPPKPKGSPVSSVDTEDETCKVSQFFLGDIFTEVEDGD